MPFLNVKRIAVPADLTLPVTAQTTGIKAAGFFAGWDSGTTNVFNSVALGGAKALQEVNGDGRIAVTSVSSWRDCEVTTYGASFFALLRLTAGRAFVVSYSINTTGGLLAIEERVGMDLSLPIALGNGTTVRTIITENGTLVSKFGPSGSVVNAGYTTAYAPGQTLTVGVVGTRLYVKWGGTIIFDLPYEAWTWMAHGKVALGPTVAYGIVDSSVDFMPLVSTLSDYSNPAAPTLRMEDFDLREIRQTGCSIAAGSTTLTVPSTTPWRAGDKGIVEIGQVTFTVTPGAGNVGNGAFVPGTPYLSTDDAFLGTWATGTWLVTFTSATSYTVTRPGGAAGGTGAVETRYNNGITFQIMNGGSGQGIIGSNGLVTFPGRVPFAAGDMFTIVCAVSGETSTATFDGKPAAGRSRTVGVGGAKPVQSITEAQLAASTNLGYLEHTLARISDNGSGRLNMTVYVGASSGGTTSYNGALDPLQDYYYNKLRPMSLKFTVVSILSPTTLQISAPAIAATANATVWIDSLSAFARVMGLAYASQYGVYQNVTVKIPAGHYTLSQQVNYNARIGWKFQGAGMDITNFYQLRGIDGSFMSFSSWSSGGDEAFADFTVWGNDHPNGGWARTEDPDPNSYIPALPNFMGLDTLDNISMNRVKIANSRGPALSINYGFDTYLRNCVSIKTVPSLNYSGWLLNVSNGTNKDRPCGIIDCTMINSWLQGALECFINDGAILDNFTMINGVFSTNSSNYYTVSNGTFRSTKNCVFNSVGFSINATPMFSINSNQTGANTFGGVVTDVDIIYEGYLNESNFLNWALAIEKSPVPGVTVDGTYNPLVANDGLRKGMISRPDWVAGNDLTAAAILVSGGAALVLTNYRLVGGQGATGYTQIHNQAGTITANNNVRDSGPAGAGTNNQSGNVTNVTYDMRRRNSYARGAGGGEPNT